MPPTAAPSAGLAWDQLAKRGVVAIAAAAGLLASPGPLGATVSRTGTFKVTATVTIGTNVPTSAALTGTATARQYGNDFTFQGESVSAQLTRSGNKAVVTLNVRYSWTLESVAATQVFVVFSVNANNAIDSSASTTIALPVPANGAVTPVSITVSI